MAEEKNKAFLAKHKEMSPEVVKQTLKDAEKSRQSYSKDIDTVEANLTGFLQREDPIVDPGTGNVIGWIRQIPIKELQAMGHDFGDIMKDKTEEEAQKLLDEDPEYVVKQFKIMESLITKPKHDAKWWSEHATMEYVKLFEIALQDSFSRTIESAGFLQEQTTASD